MPTFLKQTPGKMFTCQKYAAIFEHPPGGYSWKFLVGVCCPLLQILTLFQTKKCHFPHPFSDQTSKIHTRFQTWHSGRNYVIITYIRAQTKNSSNALRSDFEFAYFYFRSYSFGIQTITTFLHSRSRQSIYPFSDQKGPKPLPFGTAHTYMAYI